VKLDRLLATVMILVDKRRVQAKELAETFEVSIRTVYRDLELINQAGIPIVAYPGINGGVSIADGYKLDKHVLTNDELASIAVALRGVATSINDRHGERVLQKIQGVVPSADYDAFKAKTDRVFIDNGPWGGDEAQKAKIALLRQASEQSRRITFRYSNAKGERALRTVEPYTVVLKRQKWYLYAFCKDREAFRFFKLSRMKDAAIAAESFIRKEVDLDALPWEEAWFEPGNTVNVRLRFDRRVATLVDEWFDADHVEEQGDCLIVEQTFPEDDWLYGFILSFGDLVEVLEPQQMRNRLRETALQIAKIYEERPR